METPVEMTRSDGDPAEKQDFEVNRNMRRWLKMPQAVLARKVGISTSRLSRWENGLIPLTDEEKERIWEAIGADYARYMEEHPKELDGDRRALKEVRRIYGISQEEIVSRLSELGPDVSMTQSGLSAYENGYRDIDAKLKTALHQVLNQFLRERKPKPSLQNVYNNLSSLAGALHSAVAADEQELEHKIEKDVIYAGVKVLWMGVSLLSRGEIPQEKVDAHIAKLLKTANSLMELRKKELSKP